MYKIIDNQLLTGTAPCKICKAETDEYYVFIYYHGDYKTDSENRSIDLNKFHVIAKHKFGYFPNFSTFGNMNWNIEDGELSSFMNNILKDSFIEDIKTIQSELRLIDENIKKLLT